jgi:hypothetical protein
MISKHNTAIINDILIEQNIKNFDPRWIGRGALYEPTRTWVMNIPKNASNSIGRLIAPGNIPRKNWLMEQRYSEVGKPTDKFIVVLRNPWERFYGSLAQYYVIRLEHGSSLSEINQDIDKLLWMDPKFDDVHVWPQFSFLHGLPISQIKFMNLETITELPDILGISSAMESWNVSNDNDNQRATKMRIRAIAESNHNVKAHLDNYYRTDTDIMKNILGYLPNR